MEGYVSLMRKILYRYLAWQTKHAEIIDLFLVSGFVAVASHHVYDHITGVEALPYYWSHVRENFDVWFIPFYLFGLLYLFLILPLFSLKDGKLSKSKFKEEFPWLKRK